MHAPSLHTHRRETTHVKRVRRGPRGPLRNAQAGAVAGARRRRVKRQRARDKPFMIKPYKNMVYRYYFI